MVHRNGQASQPSYAQLLHENQRLRADLDAATNSSRSGGQSSPADALRPHLRMNMLDQHEQRLYTALKLHHREPTVTGIHQVLFPSSECAAILFDHGARWMWLHMAVDHQQFQMEATVYHAKCRIASPHQAAEASWLGLYFAYLTVCCAHTLSLSLLAVFSQKTYVGHPVDNGCRRTRCRHAAI